MRKRTLVIVLVALAVALTVASAAWAATQGRSVAAAKVGATQRGGAARCGALMGNPAAWKDMQSLRAQHIADMKAWYDKYGQDPNSPEAQAALAKLRTEHRNDMRALMRKYGVGTSRGVGPGMMGSGTNGGWKMMGGAGYGGGMMGSGF